MPSQRRIKVFGLLLALTIVITLYLSTSARQTRSSQFYLRTQEALEQKHYREATKQRDEEDVSSRLRAAEEAAKLSTDKKHQKYLNSVGGGGAQKPVGVAGRVQYDQGGDKTRPVQGVATVGGRARDKLANKEDETPEDHEVEVELNSILKKSPIIIFSKTYCPHSRKAKHILLDKYNLVPEPYVVELDEHPLGEKLQATLADRTGRKTVPNILILGKSIGGGDQIQELDETDKLLDTVKSMAGSRVVQAERRKAQPEMRRVRRL